MRKFSQALMQSFFRHSYNDLTKGAVTLSVALVFLTICGCGDNALRLLKQRKAIPAGLREDAQTTLRGKIKRAWGGDNFEVGQQEQLHYFFLVGVDCPEPGQPYYDEARNFLLDQTRDREIEMQVIRYDELKREVGHAWYTNDQGERVNLAIELLKRGYGWYNGKVFENSEAYAVAMEGARGNQRGLWQDPDPTPPWDYWQQVENEIRGRETVNP